MIHENKNIGLYISADKIILGKNVTFGKNNNIKCKGTFEIGDNSYIGSNSEIYGNNVKIGRHLFCSGGLRVGGGGRLYPNANLTIGDRCTIHNNFINVCEPIIIGNDVGLSPNVDFITHGYWLSVLEGYPASFKGITICDGVIIGYKSTILMGVNISKNIVIGANSVITKSLDCEKSIYAGNPCKYIKSIVAPILEVKEQKLKEIILKYRPIAEYHDVKYEISFCYPKIQFNDFCVDAETFEYSGIEDENTDDFRDYIRKYGIRIYTDRPFKSKFNF